MLDVGWSELLVIGVVALIVVGPKDLPAMFRTLGRFTAKMRGMAREFQRAMDEAAKQSGMDEAARDLKSMTSKKSLGLDALESAAAKFEKWDPAKTLKPQAAVAAAAAAKPVGPATQALAEKQAAERAVLAASQAEKTAVKMAAAPAAKPAAKARKKVAPAEVAPAKAEPVARPARTAAASDAKGTGAPKPARNRKKPDA